jgi:hypothetical protein
MTAHGARSGTKATKNTKTTKFFVIFVSVVIFVPECAPWAVTAKARR